MLLKALASPLNIVLVSPQIPPNTGNVARLCAVTGSKLILIEPLGLSIAGRGLKRAGLDYWDKVFVSLHQNYEDYLRAYPTAIRVLFSARAEKSLYQVSFSPGAHLVFGSETRGLGRALLTGGSGEVAGDSRFVPRGQPRLSPSRGG